MEKSSDEGSSANKGLEGKSMNQGKRYEVKKGLSLERWKGVLAKTQFAILPIIGPTSLVPDTAFLTWTLLLDLGG